MCAIVQFRVTCFVWSCISQPSMAIFRNASLYSAFDCSPSCTPRSYLQTSAASSCAAVPAFNCLASVGSLKAQRIASQFLASSIPSSFGYQALGSPKRKTTSLVYGSTPVALQAVEELPSKLQEIVRLFEGVPDPRAKYEQLLHYAKKLTPLGPEHLTKENKVEGCVSQVWVLPSLGTDKKVYFQAESDSVLTKGLAALLVEGLSGCTAAEILRVTPDFIQMLGLKQSLTPSRSNGFLNMLKLMQKKTLQLYMEAEGVGSGAASIESRAVSTTAESRVEQVSTVRSVATSARPDSSDPAKAGAAMESKSVSIKRKVSVLLLVWACVQQRGGREFERCLLRR